MHTPTPINRRNRGFTLIEILVVIGIIAILAAVVLVAVNPSRQFKQARDSQRLANVNTILNAIGQNVADHNGLLFCDGSVTTFPNTLSVMKSPSGGPEAQYDISTCLVPEYLPKLPFDPGADASGHFTTEDDYNTGYEMAMDEYGRVTVLAHGELAGDIEVTR